MIVLQHTRLRRAGGGDFLAGVSLDIVENGVGVDPFAADSAVGLSLSQGVADTFAEAAALQQIGTVLPNVATAFTGSDQPGVGWIALRSGDQPLLAGVGWNADAKLEASMNKALERTLAEKAAGSDSAKATGAGVKAGYEQVKKDVSNATLRNRCMAMGMFAGFKSLLLGFAMNAVRTSGNKGYDGSKPSNSWEKNAVNNARKGTSTAGRSSPPTLPGVAPQAGGPRGTPTTPGVAPQAGGPRGTPTKPGVAPEANGPRGTPTKPGLGPKAPTADESAPTQRAPAPKSAFDQFKDAQQRATDAQNKVVQHKPIDTPEGRAETNKLWNDLDSANRDRIKAWDSMPRDQRPIQIPPVPQPAAGTGSSGNSPSSAGSSSSAPASDFSGYKTGEGPVSPPQPAAGPGAKTATHEAPSSAIPEIAPKSSSPEPSVESLLNGLKGPRALDNGVLPPPNSNPSVDSLLNGLGGGGGPTSAASAPTQVGPSPRPLPPAPLPPPVAPGAGLQPPTALTEAQAARASGLAGLLDALGPMATQ